MKAQAQRPLPTSISIPIRAREFWSIASFIFMLECWSASTIYILHGCFLHFYGGIPAWGQPLSGEFVALLLVTILAAVFSGKYLWLFVLSPFASMADVSPAIAYGIPRRIHPFDRAFLQKYYRR